MMVFWSPTPVKGQNVDFGIAYVVNIQPSDQSVQDGQIVSINHGQYELSNHPYDQNVFGIIDLTPDLTLDTTENDQNKYPVVTSGQAYVLVSTQNGNIQVGDWITTSEQAGIGVKADRTYGPVVGQALAEYADTQAPGLVLATVNIGQNRSSLDNPSIIDSINALLLELLRITGSVATDRAFDMLRYIIAAFVVIISIIFAYITFGKVARTGVEASGRNPLAKNLILTGMIFNLMLAGVIIISGIIVAYLILRL